MNPTTVELGARLKSVRRAQERTLEDVATATGISLSTLSRLEAGKRQATLELLIPLTRELGIRLDDLVPDKTPDPRVAQQPVVRDGLTVVALAPDHAPVRTYKITFPPSNGPLSPRSHDGYEWLYVLSGRLRLRVAERELVLSRGEAAEFDTRLPHSMAAAGGRDAQILSIFDQSGARMHTHAPGGI